RTRTMQRAQPRQPPSTAVARRAAPCVSRARDHPLMLIAPAPLLENSADSNCRDVCPNAFHRPRTLRRTVWWLLTFRSESIVTTEFVLIPTPPPMTNSMSTFVALSVTTWSPAYTGVPARASVIAPPWLMCAIPGPLTKRTFAIGVCPLGRGWGWYVTATVPSHDTSVPWLQPPAAPRAS